MLRINEAAIRLGVAQATLRRWEARGLVHPVRTPGGERRYDEREIEELRSERAHESSRANGQSDDPPDSDEMPEFDYVTEDEPLSPSSAPSKPWEDSVHQARADLQVRKIAIQRDEIDRRVREVAERRDAQARAAERASRERDEQVRAQADDERRLSGLRQYGDMVAALAGAPVEHRAEVTRDLASYVTATQFPRSASAHAYQYIKVRVDKILQPWCDERERTARHAADEREEAKNRQRRKEVIQYGLSHAERETQLWDEWDRRDVAREVKDALRNEIDPESTRDDAVAIVDDILREWDE